MLSSTCGIKRVSFRVFGAKTNMDLAGCLLVLRFRENLTFVTQTSDCYNK